MCAFFRDVESHAAPATLSVDFSRARLRGGWRGREGLVAPRVSIRAAARARGGFDWRARAPPPRSERGRRCARPRWGVPAHTEVEETEGPEGRVHDDCLMVPRPPLSPLARSPCSHTSASPRGGAHDCPTAHDCSTTQLLNCARLLNCSTAQLRTTAQLLNCARLLNCSTAQLLNRSTAQHSAGRARVRHALDQVHGHARAARRRGRAVRRALRHVRGAGGRRARGRI